MRLIRLGSSIEGRPMSRRVTRPKTHSLDHAGLVKPVGYPARRLPLSIDGFCLSLSSLGGIWRDAMSDPEIVALRLTSRPRSDDYRQRRRDIDERGLAYGLRPDVKAEPVTANGVRAEWSSTLGATDNAALLYLHGGGYVIGSLDSHRHLVAEAGRAAGCWA